MQTGDYRGFAGHFLVWIRHWQWPVVVSLIGHVVLFWPSAMQDSVTLSPMLSAKLKAPAATPVAAATEPQVSPVLSAPPVSLPAAPSHLSLRREVVASPSEPSVPVSRVPWQVEPSTGVDAGGLREYRIRLASVLLAQVRPSLTAGMQGRLEMGVAMSASGHIEEVAIVRSSGQAALDAYILAALRASVQQVGVPASLNGQQFVATLPIEVGLPITAAEAR